MSFAPVKRILRRRQLGVEFEQIQRLAEGLGGLGRDGRAGAGQAGRDGDLAGVEMQCAAVGAALELALHEGGLAAVFAVAQDRGSDRRHMGAQLVRAARARPQRDQRRLRARILQHDIVGDGGLAVIDISNPQSPVEVGRFAFPVGLNFIRTEQAFEVTEIPVSDEGQCRACAAHTSGASGTVGEQLRGIRDIEINNP